jgi:hypothetical protein
VFFLRSRCSGLPHQERGLHPLGRCIRLTPAFFSGAPTVTCISPSQSGCSGPPEGASTWPKQELNLLDFIIRNAAQIDSPPCFVHLGCGGSPYQELELLESFQNASKTMNMLSSSLDAAGILKELATFLDQHLPSVDVVATVIGLASAIIDNVPLVAATQGMYSMEQYPADDRLWQLIAYCAGTGGSILVIGSAAGVAFMGMEKVNFIWYLKKVSEIQKRLVETACSLLPLRVSFLSDAVI